MKLNKPLEIGITGGIGSGKTLVTKIFSALGVPVYDADHRAKWVMQHNIILRGDIIAAFGKEAYTDTQQLNRSYIARQVFNNSDKVTLLNSLVHPKVAEDYALWVQANYGEPYVIKEAALLFESGSYRVLERIITVFAPIEVRLHRIRLRDPQRTIEEIQGIIGKQLSEEEKLKKADFVVYNDADQLVVPQVLRLHQQFLSLAAVYHTSK